MKIALIGFGRMGKTIANLAREHGIEVVEAIDPSAEGATHKEINRESIGNAEVCIDFSQPETVVGNIEKIASLKKNLVVGTTGWYDKLDGAQKIVEKSGIGLIYASNFSIGVNVFFKIVENAASIMNNLTEYDVFCLEMHHKNKKDSPSGTAKSIESLLLEKIGRKKKAVEEKLNREIAGNEMHVASVRGGSVPGTHSVFFDSSADTIELKHTARNRNGFALGALQAAK